jgi:hypothetical protein
MSTSRRDFLKSFAIALASVAVTRCSTSKIPPVGEKTPQDKVRDCWRRLDGLAEQTREAGLMRDEESELLNQLLNDHKFALYELANAGEFDFLVSSEMQRAFEEAATYIKVKNSVWVSCYEVSDPSVLDDMQAEQNIETVQANLLRQAELLQTYSGGISAATIAQAEQSIARDLTFLKAKYRVSELEELFHQYTSEDMDINPATLKAAQELVEILLSD